MTTNTHAPRMESEEDLDLIAEDDVDFGRYVVAIWRGLPLVIGFALVCGAFAFFVTASRPTQYEAASTLAVSGSKIGEQSPSVAVGNFRPFIENNSVAALIVKEFNLGGAPYDLTPELFRENVLSLEEVRNSNLIRLSITLGDATVAAKIANRVADLAVDGARRLSQAEAVQARDDLRVEVEDARKQMENTAAALESFKNKAQVELTREDVNAMLEERGKLLPLVVDIEEARARVRRGEVELAGQHRVDSLVKAIDSEPTLAQAARTTGEPESSLLRLQIKSEEVNKVYQDIEQQLAWDRANLAALESRRAELIGVRGLNAQQQSKLTDLYRKESELARLTTEHDVAEKSYEEIAARYDVARVQVAGRSGQIQVIDRAIVSSVPKPRHRVQNTVFAMLAGAMVSAVGIVLVGALSQVLKNARAA